MRSVVTLTEPTRCHLDRTWGEIRSSRVCKQRRYASIVSDLARSNTQDPEIDVASISV